MASAVIGALRVNLGLDSAQFAKGLKESQSSLSRVGKQMVKVGGIISGAMAGAATGVAFALRGTLNEMDAMAKTSRKLGVPVEELQRLRHAADLSGIATNTLEMALQRFTRRSAEAAAGTGEAKAALEEMGIELKDASGNLRPTSALLDDVSDAFAGIEDPAKRLRLAFKLFDSEGTAMINMLGDGSAALGAMKAEADALGVVFSEQTAKSAEQFNDNLTRMGRVFDGLKTIIAAELAPVLADLSDWFAQNGPMIVAQIRGVVDWFKRLSPETKRLAGFLAALTAAVGPVLIGLGTLAIIVGAISTPVLVVVGAIAALGAAFVFFRDDIANAAARLQEWWDQFKAWAADTAATIKGAVTEAWEGFWRRVGEIVDDFIIWMELIPANIASMAASAKAKLEGFAEDIAAAFAGLPEQLAQVGRDAMAGLLRGMTEGSTGPVGHAAWVGARLIEELRRKLGIQSPSKVFHQIGIDTMQGLANGLRDGSATATTSASATVDQILAEMGRLEVNLPEQSRLTVEATGSQFSTMLDPLKEAFKTTELSAASFKDGLIGVMTRLRDTLLDQAFRPIENALGSLFSGLLGGGGGGLFGGGAPFKVNSFLPNFAGAFAAGGTIPRGSWGIAGEGGRPEIVAGPAQVFSNADSQRMLGNGGGVSLTMNVDARGSTMAASEWRRIAREESQRAVAGLVESNREYPIIR